LIWISGRSTACTCWPGHHSANAGLFGASLWDASFEKRNGRSGSRYHVRRRSLPSLECYLTLDRPSYRRRNKVWKGVRPQSDNGRPIDDPFRRIAAGQPSCPTGRGLPLADLCRRHGVDRVRRRAGVAVERQWISNWLSWVRLAAIPLSCAMRALTKRFDDAARNQQSKTHSQAAFSVLPICELRGSRTVNSVNSPTRLSTSIVPPCCWVTMS
jgi:hypothetical protein